MQSNRSGQARAVLSEVQSRHDDIKKIEKTILELHQLFVDMQMMVEQQQEVFNQIETHAENVVVDLEVGNQDIEKAIVSAKSTRAVSQKYKANKRGRKPNLNMNRKNGFALSFSLLSLLLLVF